MRRPHNLTSWRQLWLHADGNHTLLNGPRGDFVRIFFQMKYYNLNMRQCHCFAQKKEKEKEEGKKRKRKLSLENQTIAMTPLRSGFLIRKIF